ncbi:helix-turn-helix domain-containing protein [Marinobacter hydrocarbonoclasticus]|nr:helix-turn-helix domain-containing protein [Marinobacter nauticus]
MRPSGIKLNGPLIKQRRAELKLTQTDLAAIVFTSERHIQRIESGDSAGRAIANRLAEALKVDIEQLTTTQRNDLWLVSTDESNGTITKSLKTFWPALEAAIDELYESDGGPLSLAVADQPLCKTIELKRAGKRLKQWTLRPIMFHEAGIQWVKLHGIDQLFWESDLETLSMTYVADVTINGKPLTAPDTRLGYQVVIAETAGSRELETVQTHDFFDETDFGEFLSTWQEAAKQSDHPTFAYPWGDWRTNAIVITRQYQYREQVLSVQRVALDHLGQVTSAPWPRSHQQQMVEAVNGDKSPPSTCSARA